MKPTSKNYRKYKTVLIIRSNAIRPDSRVEKEANTLYNAGFRVGILAWDRDSNHPEHTEMLYGNTEIPITRYGFKAGFGDGLKKIKQFLLFQIAIQRFIKKHNTDIDYIHACDFDTAFFTYRLAHKLKKKFVFDIFDFIFGEPHNVFQVIINMAQIDIINHADATIICSEERRRQISKATPQKLTVIHNSPPMIESSGYVADKDYVARVVYVGVLQNHRLLKEIGEFFREHSEYRFDVGGFGLHESFFERLDKECSNIYYHGRINYATTLEVEQRADIMLAIYDPSIENHRYAAPNKFYEGLMLGKPLIMANGTGMSDVIEREHLGAVIDYSPEGFAKGMEDIVGRRDDWENISLRMKALYKEKYSWSEMEKRLIQLYDNL